MSSATVGSSAVPRNCGLKLALIDAFDAGTKRSEELVRRVEEVDGLAPVVHGDDEPGPKGAYDRGGRLAADGRAAAGEPPITSTAL